MKPRMKQARTGTNEVGSPSFHQPLLTEMLRALVALVPSVASTFQMKRNHPPPDWRTGPAEALLPRMKTDTQQQETNSAIQHDGPSALILSSTQSVRPSKREPSFAKRTNLSGGPIRVANARSASAGRACSPPPAPRRPNPGQPPPLSGRRNAHVAPVITDRVGDRPHLQRKPKNCPRPGPRSFQHLRTSILPARGKDKDFAGLNGSATTSFPPTRLPRDRTRAPIHRLAPGTRIRAHSSRIKMRHP
jgi:hypothetical protein